MAGAVFLSYASQDAESARRLAEALQAGGVEVWFDRSELRGGDAWDQKIRRQIRECALFLPVISAATQARREGYFRREWKLAVERTHDMADGTPFLVPVVIDGTKDRDALVPEVFLKVQWTRLPGGEAPDAFVRRVRTLLGDAAGVAAAGNAGGADGGPASAVMGPAEGAAAGARGANPPSSSADPRSPARSGRSVHSAARPAPGRRLRGWTMGGLTALIVGVAVALIHRSRLPVTPDGSRTSAAGTSTSPAGSPAVPGRSTNPPSPAPNAAADPNVARALQLIGALKCPVANVQVAEDLCRAALAAHPTDPAATVAMARVQTYYLMRGYDTSEARYASARTAAERALALAPDDPDALEAMANYLVERHIELPRAEQLLRQALAQRPQDPALSRRLDEVLFDDPAVPQAEALASARRTAQRFPEDALAQYDLARHYRDAGEVTEAEHYLDLAIKFGPIANAVIAKARMGLALKGDVAGMKALIDRLPDEARGSERAIVTRFIYACASQRYDDGLEALRATPAPWFSDFDYTGPKQLLEGELFLLDGKPELARQSYEAALAELGRHPEVVTDNFRSRWLDAWLLNRLGRRPEALASNAIGFSELERPFRIYIGTNWWFNPIVGNLLLGERNRALELMREAVLFQHGRTIIAHMLAVDPRMTPWRDDPDIAALLAAPEVGQAIPSAYRPATAPRDWPHDSTLRRAMQLLEGTESIADDFALAEELAQRAVAQAPADPEAATVLARVETAFLQRGFDLSDGRAALAKRTAARALQLAPDDPEALFAEADFLYDRRVDLPQAERLLRRACELGPDRAHCWRLLADVIFDRRPAEGLAQEERNAARFPRDALVHYDFSRLLRASRRWRDMERELDATIALNPIPNALIWKARAQLGLHGDIAGMKTWLDQIPSRVRDSARTVFSVFVWAALSGHPDAGLDALNAYPETWLADWEFVGPAALLRASLLQLQGKPELARLQAQAALAEVQRREAADPADPELRTAETWALCSLGRMDEARAANRVSLESLPRPLHAYPLTSWWFQAIPCNLLIGERSVALQLIREAAGSSEGRETIRQRMTLDPRMAPWRADPEITALLAEPTGKR
jgi:tetratricopeptide (TPR) repeat protein